MQTNPENIFKFVKYSSINFLDYKKKQFLYHDQHNIELKIFHR